MTVRESLEVILAAAADFLRVTCQENLIIVTMDGDLKRYTKLVNYNIRDLIEAIIANSRSDLARKREITRQEAVDQLVQTIPNTIDPDSWQDNGGNLGAIKEIMGVLVIQQTAENQDAVRKKLDNLRRANGLR